MEFASAGGNFFRHATKLIKLIIEEKENEKAIAKAKEDSDENAK